MNKSRITGIRYLPVVGILISVGVSALLPYMYYSLFNVKLDTTMSLVSIFIFSLVLGFGFANLLKSRSPITERPSICGRCGASVSAGELFCTGCGTPQPVTTLESGAGRGVETVETPAIRNEPTSPVRETKITPEGEPASTLGPHVKPNVAPAESGYCAECGAPIAADDDFCENCGAPIQ